MFNKRFVLISKKLLVSGSMGFVYPEGLLCAHKQDQ